MGKPSKKTLANKKLADGHVLPWDNAMSFVLAGYCVVTLEQILDGARNTYFVSQCEDEVKDPDTGKVKKVKKNRWFVSLLVGADNKRSYSYIGVIDQKHGARRFRTTKPLDGISADAINRVGDVVRWLVEGCDNSHQVRVWHRGLCGKCGIPLTVPASIATGLGPVCAKHLGVSMKDVTPDTITKLGALAPSIEPENSNEG